MQSFKDYAEMRDQNLQLESAKKAKKSKEDWVEKFGKKFDKDVYQGQYDKIAYGRFYTDPKTGEEE
jgi:hypothetical protein